MLEAADRIRVLDAHVVNKIAAGEVVERPASVVKELVENAIDAHATRIEVFLEKGGTQLIRIVDDGWGMSRSDLELAFFPHATSKLADVDDLDRIATMGFRGEALASIGAVSQASIVTRTREEEAGLCIENDGGRMGPPRPAAAACGTEVVVRNLFFNTPARARFLRTERTELGHVQDWLTRFALAFPEVGFRLVHDGSDLLRTAPGEERSARLRALYGPELADSLLVAQGGDETLHVRAYLAPPSRSRPTAREMHFFLNGRWIRDRLLHRIVKDAYRDALHGGRYPVAFLFLECDPAAVDVNVHPTKAEVRWRDGRRLHSILGPALARALREADLASRPLDFLEGDDDSGAAGPEGRNARVRAAIADFLGREGGLLKEEGPRYAAGAPGRNGGEEQSPAARTAGLPFRVVQMHKSYLVCEVEDGIAIVDQHALHERVQYDRILRRLVDGGVESQRLLVPEEVELSGEELGLLRERRDLLRRCGIEWSPFGERSVALEAIPAVVPREKSGELLRDLADLFDRHGGEVDARVLFHDVADTMACKAAVRFGDALDRVEAEALLLESGALEKAFVCPHGRPTVLRLPFAALEKHFQRR